MGKMLVIIGIAIVILGIIIQINGKIPFLGRLPGDISIQKKNFQFYFPLTSSLLISALITLIIMIIRWVRG
jgi:hypothetical protein